MSSTPSTTNESVTPEQAKEISRQVAGYIKIGLASVFFTCLTVALSYITKGNILVAMILAACNGSLILFFTMHLKSEKPSITRAAYLSFFFFADLILITLLAVSDRIHL